ASAGKAAEPSSPALGPREPPSTTEDSEQPSSTQSNEPTGQSKDRTVASNRTSTLLRQGSGGQASQSSRARTSRSEDNYSGERNYQGRHRAEVVGKTADGGLIVRLSSGRVVTLPPLNNDGVYRARPRHRDYTERPDNDF